MVACVAYDAIITFMKRLHTGTLNVLNETFRGYRRHFALLLLLAVFSAALDGIGINAIIPLISFLLGGGGAPTDFISHAISQAFAFVGVPFQFRYLLIFIGILFVGRALVLTLFAYIRARVNASFLAREIGTLLRAAMQADWPFMLRQKAGSVQSTVYTDAKRNGDLLDAVVQLAQSGTGALIYLAVAVNINPLITGLTLAGGAVIFLVMQPLTRKSRAFGAETSASEKLLVHHITEHLHGFKAVKAAGVAEKVSAAAEPYLRRLRDAFTNMVLVRTMSAIYIQPIAFLFIIGVFAFTYDTPGFSLAGFAATVYLIQKIFVYFETAQSTIHGIIQLVPFAENIMEFKRQTRAHGEAPRAGGRPFLLKHEIEFRDVSFSYESGKRVLSHLSCRIRKGSMLGIIGPSGGGKTSFADLILRLFQPSEGEILVDGTPAEEFDLGEWRTRVGYVSQDAFLMHASIADNIRFYDDSITQEQLEHAARAAHIYNDVMRLPNGFETVIGDRGVTLSGGQRQRVALARALSRAPEVLVLDEVTSSLDSELERLIKDVIDELRGEVTLIVIAHRISTILASDDLLVLADGSIQERGTPEKMLANPDSYLSRMHTLQSSGER